MKRLPLFFLILVLLMNLVGCGVDVSEDPHLYEPTTAASPEPNAIEPHATAEPEMPDNGSDSDDNSEPEPEIRCFNPNGSHNEQSSVTISSSIPLDIAETLFSELCSIYSDDNGSFWGFSLHTPVIIADLVTGDAVSNQPFPGNALKQQGNVYVGTLPESQSIHSKAVKFGNQWWGMLSWNPKMITGEDGAKPLRDMIHEAFHAKQFEHFGTPRNYPMDSDEYDMNTSVHIQLEMSALLKALVSNTEEERQHAINDALSIREERRIKGLGLTLLDIQQQISEGLAQYTELMLGLSDPVARLTALEEYIEKQSGTSGIRTGSSYAFGALYGMLLDEFSSDWRFGVCFTTDLGQLLQEAAGISKIKPFDEIDTEQYGYSGIIEKESEFSDEIKSMIQATRAAFAGQTVLRIGGSGKLSGDFQIISVPELRGSGIVYYGDFVFYGAFGQLTISNGPLLQNNRIFEVPDTGIKINDARAFGKNWELELNDGFTIVELSSGGYSVVRSHNSP